ncbi:unnamed protein product [Cuscuta europaea]|uniref:Uncharacterized protein n=1 Tax=Cuscuta europaea TaxID=41803 RepID=A0A9P1A082_CUSEU|nr:unnamed protein product [Cuscuta europaea]
MKTLMKRILIFIK